MVSSERVHQAEAGIVVCNAVDYDFSASGVQTCPTVVNTRVWGLVGYHISEEALFFC